MNRLKKSFGAAALVADICLLTSGCVIDVADVHVDGDFDHSGHAEVSAVFSRTLDVHAQTRIRVTAVNGSVKVWGVPGAQEILVDGVRRVRSDSRADAERHLPDLRVVVQERTGEFEIKTVQPSQTHGRSYIVDYEIIVPAHLIQDITNGNGSVRLEGIEADMAVRNGNGEVHLVNVVGSSTVTVGNGEISAWTYLPAGGHLVHSIGNGALFLEVQPEVSASFGATVGNGTIEVTGLDLRQAVSTPRQLHGILGSGQGVIDLSTGNGQIRVNGG